MKTKNGWGMFRLGLRRRKKETRRLRLMTALSVFFLAFTLLFQDNMGAYQTALNDETYGAWFVRSGDDSFEDHPYLRSQGEVLRGSLMFSGLTTAEILTGEKSADEMRYDEYLAAFYERDGDLFPLFQTQHVGDGTGLDFIGSFPSGFAEENRIALLSGRWPEADDEIVMTIPALGHYGYSMTLGQTVTFYLQQGYASPFAYRVDESEISDFLFPVSYRLVGIMEDYLQIWDAGQTGELPAAVVTEAALKQQDMLIFPTRFYAIRDEYKTAHYAAFAASLAKAVGENGDCGFELTNETALSVGNRNPDVRYYSVNRSGFETAFWGDAGIFTAVTVLLVVMSAAVAAYLYASYLSRRRVYFLRMREMGLSVREIWKMAAFECVFSVLPTALATLAFSYGLSILAVFFIAKGTGLPFFYRFSVVVPGAILLLFLLITGLALLLILPTLSGRRVSLKRRGLSKHAVRRLRRRVSRTEKRKTVLGASETLLRRQKTRPVQTFALRVLTVFVSAVLLFGAAQILSASAGYRAEVSAPTVTAYAEGTVQKWTLKLPVFPYEDLKGRVLDTRSHSVEAYAFTSAHVVPETVLSRLTRVPGVLGLDNVFRDVTHVLSWAGKETNETYRSSLETLARRYAPEDLDPSRPEIAVLYNKVEPLLYSIVCFEDDKKTDAYLSAADPDVYDAEAFREGRQALLLLDPSMGLAQNETVPLPELGLSPGDLVTVETAAGPLTLTLAGVCRNTDRAGTGLATLLVSPAFVRTLSESDGVPFGYNTVGLRLDPKADLMGAAETAASLLTGAGARYENRAELVKNARRGLKRAVLSYGAFALILVSLGLLVLNAAANEERRRNADAAKRLSRLGLESRRYRRAVLIREGKESLFAMLGLPIAVISMLVTGGKEPVWSSYAVVAAAAILYALMVFLCRAGGALWRRPEEKTKKEV